MDSASTSVAAGNLAGSRFPSTEFPADLLRRCERRLQSPVVWAVALAFVAIVQIALIFTHQPWLDEYQALLIATEPHTIGEVLRQLHYEGHPPLWYLLLRALSSFVPTPYVLPAASLLCAGAIQGSLLAYAPFSRFERLMLALGEIFLFEYGTISRGLSLGVALTLLCMVLWRTRAVWISVALLPLCEFLFGVLSIGLLVLLWRERRLSRWGIALWAICSAVAAVSVVPALDARHAMAQYSVPIEIVDFVARVGTIALPLQTFEGNFAWDGTAPSIAGLILAPLFLMWVLKRTRHSPTQRGIFVAFFGVIGAVSVLTYSLHFRYVSLLALLLVVFAWLDRRSANDPWWTCWLITSALCGVHTSALALTTSFDASRVAATVISKLDDGRTPWLAYPASRIAPLHALTGKRFIQPEQGCSHGYVLWNHQSALQSWDDYAQALTRWANEYGRSFIVLEYPPRGVPPTVFKPLTGRLRGYDGQRYMIGVLAPGQSVKHRIFPQCAPGEPEKLPRR